jgi:4-hydroxymandelate oxidase
MNLTEVQNNARKRLNGVCKVCRVCDGQNCIGGVPGMGGKGTGASFRNNITSLSKILLNLRTIHGSVNPDLSYDLFGFKLKSPILCAPMCETKNNFQGKADDKEFITSQVLGAKESGSLAMTGDSPQVNLYQMGLEAIQTAGGLGIPIIKPRDSIEILKRIRLAEQAGTVAVGIDIDAAGFVNMIKAGQPVGPKTCSQLHEIIQQTSLPVILKGIMTADEALKAVEVGAAGIVVSNHGGRSLDHTPGTVDVLPEIFQAVKGKLKIFIDGGFRTGEDVLKALALGAEAVLIGRPVAVAAIGGGIAGAKLLLETIAEELKVAMLLTGCEDLNAIGPAVIRTVKFPPA